MRDISFFKLFLYVYTYTNYHVDKNYHTSFITKVLYYIIAGTVLLWMTYIDIKKTLDKTDPNQLLEEAVRNERAFLAFSIIATIITVSVTFYNKIKNMYMYIHIHIFIKYFIKNFIINNK